MFEEKSERAERAEAVARKFKEEGKAKAKPAKKPKTNVAVVEVPKKLTVEQFDKKLAPIANEINVRFEKIAKLDGQADDHRLAAALRLEEAKKLCGAQGIGFRKWVEDNVKDQSWETVRKLAVVGGSPNPQIALEDMRKKNAAANKAHRAKKKVKEIERKVFGPAEVLLSVKPEEAMKAVRAFAADAGLEVLSKTDVSALKQQAKGVEMKKAEGLDALKASFMALTARDKMDFVRFAAAEVGGKFVSALGDGEPQTTAADDDPLAIPPGLRRTRKT